MHEMGNAFAGGERRVTLTSIVTENGTTMKCSYQFLIGNVQNSALQIRQFLSVLDLEKAGETREDKVVMQIYVDFSVIDELKRNIMAVAGELTNKYREEGVKPDVERAKWEIYVSDYSGVSAILQTIDTFTQFAKAGHKPIFQVTRI